jgi:hypothetical protein
MTTHVQKRNEGDKPPAPIQEQFDDNWSQSRFE